MWFNWVVSYNKCDRVFIVTMKFYSRRFKMLISINFEIDYTTLDGVL